MITKKDEVTSRRDEVRAKTIAEKENIDKRVREQGTQQSDQHDRHLQRGQLRTAMTRDRMTKRVVTTQLAECETETQSLSSVAECADRTQ